MMAGGARGGRLALGVWVFLSAAWLFHMIPALISAGSAPERLRVFELAGVFGATAALAGALAVEAVRDRTGALLLLQIVLVASGVSVILLTTWWRFHKQRVAFAFGMDFILCLLSAVFLVATLLLLAGRLHAHAPFASVLVGSLSFFLPINALAEVFHAGRNASRRDR